MTNSTFNPAWLPLVNKASLRADAMAGLLGVILVLPQGIAFATLAGLPPEYGLYSAIIPTLVAALFGSSRHVVTGPTNANSLALFAMLSPLAMPGTPTYIQLALAVTVLVGLMQLTTGLLRIGSLANFISPTALLGFTSGAALLIALHALKEALGIEASSDHGTFQVLQSVAMHLEESKSSAIVVTLATIVSAAWIKRHKKHWPYMLIGLCVGAVVAWLCARGSWGTTTRVLGTLPSPVPHFHLPDISWEQLPDLIKIASALTVVALAQSISIAKAVAERSGQRIDGNREFVGQGLANVLGGCFSSYVACGSLNRSMPNFEAGARTPLASVFAALMVIPLVAMSSSLLAIIPYAAISGLLILVAWSLLDLGRWRALQRTNRPEFLVAFFTLLATVFLRMEVAILIGSALSLGLFLHRTSKPAMRTMGFNRTGIERPFVVVSDTPSALPECPQIKLLRMEGSVYFGATAHVSDELQALRNVVPMQKHLLVMTKSMNFIDAAGAQLWRSEMMQRRAMGGDLYFHRPRPPVLEQWHRDGFIKLLGEDHIYADKRSAIHSICQRLDMEICRTCTLRVFAECSTPSQQAPGAAMPLPSKPD
jgi:sulfate permease, SulP family